MVDNELHHVFERAQAPERLVTGHSLTHVFDNQRCGGNKL